MNHSPVHGTVQNSVAGEMVSGGVVVLSMHLQYLICSRALGRERTAPKQHNLNGSLIILKDRITRELLESWLCEMKTERASALPANRRGAWVGNSEVSTQWSEGVERGARRISLVAQASLFTICAVMKCSLKTL